MSTRKNEFLCKSCGIGASTDRHRKNSFRASAGRDKKIWIHCVKQQPPSDLYGLAGRLIFCVSTTNILRSGASRSVPLRSGAGAGCGLCRRDRNRTNLTENQKKYDSVCKLQPVLSGQENFLSCSQLRTVETETLRAFANTCCFSPFNFRNSASRSPII